MLFKAYPNNSTTPNRKARKSERNKVFIHNYKLRARLKREQRTAAKALNNN